MKILSGITWILCVIGSFTTAIAVLNCTNYKGEPVADGAKFKPKKHDLCLECVCDKGSMTMCQNIFCSHPDNCKDWERVSTECCEFICLSNEYDNTLESDVHPNQTKTKNDDTTVETAASDNITTLGLRLVASTVTSFLVLALLLFMVHRLRQRRLLLAMRRYGARREEMDNFDNENLTPEYFGIQCPPYDDPPPPYSPPKPPHQILPNEAPPPYELINNNNNNNNNVTETAQNTGSANNYQTREHRCRTSRREVDRIQQALNNEILQNVQQRQSSGSDTRPYTGSRRHTRRSGQLCNNDSSSSGSSDSSDQETVSVNVHTGARYLRKSNSAVGVISMSHDRRPNRGRDRRSIPGNCRIGHSSSFASSFTPCSHNGRHQMSHSLCNSHSHDAVARQQSHDEIAKQCVSESTQTSSLHRPSQRTCGHHNSRLSRDSLNSRKLDPLQLTDISNQSSQVTLCQNMPNCHNSTQDGGNFPRRRDSSHNSIDLDINGGHRTLDSQSVDKFEGYVPPCFQELNDNDDTGHLAMNNPYHQRYGSLPANTRLNDEKSGKRKNVRDPDTLDKSPVRVNNDSQGQTQSVDEALRNTTFYMPKVKTLPSDLSPEFNSALGQANLYSSSVGQDNMYSGELVTFKAPSTNRPQSLGQLNASVLPFHLPDISTVSESGNSTCVSPLSIGIPDYNQLQELRLSNLLRQNHNSNSSSPGESPHQLQQAPCQNSNQNKEMPRSNSDVSMFSVCSETGEKKLGRLINQVTGSDCHAIGNDAQYPENAFGGRPNLSVFTPRDDAISYHNPRGTGISYPSQRVTMLANSNPENVAEAECLDNDCKKTGDPRCENTDQNGRLTEDSVNGNVSVNSDLNSVDNVSKDCDTNREFSTLGVTHRNSSSHEDPRAQYLGKESLKQSHVKLRHKSKSKKHRLSPGSLPSATSNKKRHSYASDSRGSLDLSCDVDSVDLHSLPRSQVRGKKNRPRSQNRGQGRQISVSCVDDDDRTSEKIIHDTEEQRLVNGDDPHRVNSWGEVSGLYAVTNIMDSYGDKRQKGPLHPKHKSKSTSGKNLKCNGNNPSLFCPSNIKKRTKSSKRASKSRNSYPSIHNFQGNDLAPVSKVPDRHLEDVQLSPLSKLGEQEISQSAGITLTNSSLV